MWQTIYDDSEMSVKPVVIKDGFLMEYISSDVVFPSILKLILIREIDVLSTNRGLIKNTPFS